LLLLEGFVKRRIALTAVLAIGLAIGTAGCTFLAPQATLLPYDQSDGVNLTVGAIQLRNAFAISPKGTDANFVGVLINSSKSAEVVELQYTAHIGGRSAVESYGILLAGGQVVSFGNPHVKQLVFRNADVQPGALLKVFIQYGGVSGKTLQIPVLNGSQTAYQHLAPSPTPTPTSTGSPAPVASSAP
jgi:hypothetical protein